MLYPKNKEKELSVELFRHPTCEYRGTPFWAWNCSLEKDELLRQIEVLHEMGFGGFHIHVRSGMATEYLSEEFMELVAACVDKAKEEEMLVWLYDEDRWPSGFAGGLVTKDEKYRSRRLRMTVKPYGESEENEAWTENEYNIALRSCTNVKLLGRYAVKLSDTGCLESYRLLAKDETGDGEGTIWYAYVESPSPDSRFNGYTYVNVLDKASIERFIEVTHETYKRKVGAEFGKTIPAIFTDEPQTVCKGRLKFATGTEDVTMPYTDDLEESFYRAYGVSLLEHLPEIFWDLPKGQVSRIRYLYHDHVAERFVSAFADTIGAWCDENGILLTGHMMQEPTLGTQTGSVGDVMRSYRSFGMPGIDMLADYREFNTAKQAQSAVNQKGSEGMLDELYGVTTWDFDFRRHKSYGDWQAALGVTVRVPHLSWVSMEGEAKRDYPASISYQSPWHEEYSYIEDHYARVNTAMTRGEPVVRVGVLHPVESYWLHCGPAEQTALVRREMNKNFKELTEWLLLGGIDFDFICESTLPMYCEKGGVPFKVGKMKYDVIVVSGCETLRRTTLERLVAFREAGGTLIFMGEAPKYVDAIPSDEPAKLYACSQSVSLGRDSLLTALDPFRTVELRSVSGELCDNLLYRMRREENNELWLFVAQGKEAYNRDITKRQDIFTKVAGTYSVTLYDTLSGEIYPAESHIEKGWTVIPAGIYQNDSLLYRLTPVEVSDLAEGKEAVAVDFQEKLSERKFSEKKLIERELEVPAAVEFTLNEPNALVIDMAKWAVDGEALNSKEEILRIDTAVRGRFGWSPWGGRAHQPWCLPKKAPEHTLRLVCEIESEIDYESPLLAMENPENAEIIFNSVRVNADLCGWYVDKSIKTLKLPPLQRGINTLEVRMPYGERTAAEWMYLLGAFGVRVEGSRAVVTRLPQKLSFGNIVHKGLPFYSGKLTYHFDITTEGSQLNVRVSRYRGALLRIHADEESKPVAFSPYVASFTLPAGEHKVDIDVYINRTNGFGPLHLSDEKLRYQDPLAWRTTGDSWSYEYNLMEEGILSAPKIVEIKEVEV